MPDSRNVCCCFLEKSTSSSIGTPLVQFSCYMYTYKVSSIRQRDNFTFRSGVCWDPVLGEHCSLRVLCSPTHVDFNSRLWEEVGSDQAIMVTNLSGVFRLCYHQGRYVLK